MFRIRPTNLSAFAGVLCTGLLLLCAGAAPLAAQELKQELKIAMKASVDSADPHLLFTPNRNVLLHVYEPLVFQDRYLKPIAGLAESWTVVDPTTWEFRLRAGVKFHDGLPLTASDVVFSVKRAQAITGVRTYRHYLKDIAEITPVDDRTVRIKTFGPAALLLSNLSTLGIVSQKTVESASGDDVGSGKAANGTGPYRWAGFIPSQQVNLERNDAYWREKEPWAKVTIRFVPDDAARAAALLSGDVDVIDVVPGSLRRKLADAPGTKLVTDTSIFALYMHFDRFRDNSPFVAGLDGKPLAENPLKDKRVLAAMSHAINRVALAERIMDGGAEPAGQLAPPNFAGHDPKLAPPAYDPKKAKELLAQAGYPGGFQLTIHCMNNRYSGDVQTCQAIASMFTAVGIRTKVEALPIATFFRRQRGGGANGEPEFSSYLAIFGSSSGDQILALVTLMQTNDDAKGVGGNNNGRYSNPEVDRLILKAQETLDDAERESIMHRVMGIAMAENAVMPIYFLKSSWGVSRKLNLAPSGDQYTKATNIRPAKP
ncbi:MAG: peptide/nickel transport system substrate-binding protein [Hyphomicrobiales bacterium]